VDVQPLVCSAHSRHGSGQGRACGGRIELFVMRAAEDATEAAKPRPKVPA
jgi:hypothetical protein